MDRFSDEAATWDEKPGNADRAREVAAVVRAALPLRPDMTVLEVGGGTGLLSRELVHDIGVATVTDVAPGMVAAAAERLTDPAFVGWRAERFDIEHDPLPPERYDLVLALLALHHMGDVAAVITRTAELLKPGGHLALIDLDHDPGGHFHASVHDFHGHDGFSRDSVRRWLTDAGYVDVAISSAGTVVKEDGEYPMFLATGHVPTDRT